MEDTEAKLAPMEDPDDTLSRMIMCEWEKAGEYVTDLNDLYDDLYAMLRGERPERNYDWQSNIVINKVFQVIWTAVPYLISKIFGATPIIGLKSFDKKGAWERSTILQFWYTMQRPDSTPFFLTVVMLLLRGMLNGVAISKKTWHQKLKTVVTEQQEVVPLKVDEAGNEIEAEPVRNKRRQTIPLEDWPVNEVVNNKDVRFDWMLKPGQSIRQGRFIIHRTIEDKYSLEMSKLYENLDKICADTTETESDHSENRSRDGQESPPKSDFYDDIELYERQGLLCVSKASKGPFKYKYDPEGDEKEMVVTLAKAAKGDGKWTIVRFEKNPYGEKAYNDLHIYLDPERWQSMGQIEPIRDLQTAMNDNINAAFDEINQNLMPPVIVDKNALWDYDTMVYAPQQRWMMSGNPSQAAYFKPPTQITNDAWRRHMLFESEIQLTSAATNSMQGAGTEKTATTNILNSQMSAGKLDFILRMVEATFLVPNAQMDIRFAQKFAHPLTFVKILGSQFKFGDWEEIYQYVPAASSVKTEYQKDAQTREDIQLIQIFAGINNPNTMKILNALWANILRNRDMPQEAAAFDEQYFEPGTEAGQMQQLTQMLNGGTPNNQQGIGMSPTEQNVRQSTYPSRGVANY